MKCLYIVVALLAFSRAQQENSGCDNDRFHLGFSGVLESMNFDPEGGIRYDAHAFCHWNLETSQAQDRALEINFEYMNVEAAVTCMYDAVTVYEGIDDTGPVLAQLCGYNIPNKVIARDYLAYVTFTSDATLEYFGFNATWHSRDMPIECESELSFRCGDDITGFCIPSTARCDGVDDCSLGEDEVGCPVNSDTCGSPTIPPNTNSTISTQVAGGTEAIPGSWPWMAGVLDAYQVHMCGGAVLNDRWIITAASCVWRWRDQPSQVNYIVGNHDYEVRETHESTHHIGEIHIHPSYGVLKQDHNFALIKSKGRIVFAETVSDICVPPLNVVHPNGTVTWFTGWGSTLPSAQAYGSNTLLQAEMTIYNDDFCNDPSRYNGEITHGELCAGSLDGSVGACEGDDGGPLVWFNDDPGVGDGKWYLLGVAGHRDEDTCAVPNVPGVFGEVAAVVSWIEDILQNN